MTDLMTFDFTFREHHATFILLVFIVLSIKLVNHKIKTKVAWFLIAYYYLIMLTT